MSISTQEAGRRGAQARNVKYSPEKRSEISKRAAKTRIARYGYNAFKAMGKLGAQARHSISQVEEKIIAIKAAKTRLKINPNAFREMGERGAKVRHDKTPEEERRIAEKAAATRKERDPHAFEEMGRKGGERSHSRHEKYEEAR